MTVAVQGERSNAVVAVETNPSQFIDFYMGRVAR
jgi:hypothetical protein